MPYLDFLKIIPDRADVRITSQWSVIPRTSNDKLGTISWYAPWRKYCFYTIGEKIFDADCLQEISEFCQRETAAHKETQAERKKSA